MAMEKTEGLVRKEVAEELETLANALLKAKESVQKGEAGIKEVPPEGIIYVDTFGLVKGIASINIEQTAVHIRRD